MTFSLRRKDVNMLEGSILKGLLRIAIPIMIMNVTMSLFNVVDMTVLRMYDAENGYAVGAVGACGTLIGLITGLLIGCSAGANVVIARYIGQGDTERVKKATGAAIFFSFVGGLFLTVVGVVFAKTFLCWMKCPDELLSDAVLYFRMYFAGVPILMVYNFSAAILRSAGDSSRPMMFLIVGSAVKLAFTFLFVAVFNMTVDGVGYATIISWIVMTVLGCGALLTHKGVIRLYPSKIRPYGRELREMLVIGIPAGLQQALYSIANVIIATAVNSFGPKASTGLSIANNFDSILYNLVTASALAVMPYVSQNIGHGTVKRARRAVIDGIIITTALGATFGALSAIFSADLASLMSKDPEVIGFAQQKMIIISSTYFICGINNIFCEALRGMGRPALPTISTLVYMCLIRFVWVYLVFPLVPNFTFLYLIWPIGWVLSIITLLPFYFTTMRRLEKNATPCKKIA